MSRGAPRRAAPGARRAALMLAAALLPAAAGAQALSLRALPDPAQAQVCAPVARPAPPDTASRARARRLTTEARRSAALGDQRAARERLLEAAKLDPADADVAYVLARTHEALGSAAEARAEYCRYLALAPAGGEAEDVRDRLDRLTPRAPAPPADAVASLREGLAAHAARDLSRAEAAFGRAIALAPSWGTAWYDRAVVRLARGRDREALDDLVRYLEVEPAAPDREAVVARIAQLRRRTLDPSRALASGLLAPGLAQLQTRRPVAALAVLGATAGAVAWGLRSETRAEQRTGTFVDPFGVERSYSYTADVTERPHAVVGLSVAAAVWLAGAIEGWRYARAGRGNDAAPRPAPRVSPAVVPVRDGVGVGVSLAFGAR